MSIEDIHNKVSFVNEMGSRIIVLSDVVFALPEEVQPEYAAQLLDIVQEYYQTIDSLKQDVVEYRNEEKGTISFSIKKLENTLSKFS